MTRYEYDPTDGDRFPAGFCKAVGAVALEYAPAPRGRGAARAAQYVEAYDAAGQRIELDGTQQSTFEAQLTTHLQELGN